MKAFEQLERLKRMNRLIKERRTGTPSEFAKYLGISERHLYNSIEEIKEMGIIVKYTRVGNTFYYETGTELEIGYSLKIVQAQELKIIYGGSKLFHSLLFLCREAV